MFWISKQDFDRAIRGIHYHLNRIENNMATQAELDAKLDELKAAATKEIQQLADAIAAIPAAVDLAPQVAKVQAIIDALGADDPAPPPAAPPA